MRLVIIWGLLISAICFEIFSICACGWFAEVFLNCRGRNIRSFIIGILGYAISIVLFAIIFYVANIYLDSLMEILILVAYVMLLFLRLMVTILVMSMYKLAVKLFDKVLLEIKERKSTSIVEKV